jgi:hypothetical protein
LKKVVEELDWRRERGGLVAKNGHRVLANFGHRAETSVA